MNDTKLRIGLFWSLVLCLIGVNIYHVFMMSKTLIDVGDDSILYHFSTGYALLHAESLQEFWYTLIAGFRFEDHLAPMSYIYGLVIQLISSDAEFISTIFAKIIYFLNVGLILFVTYDFWKNKSKVAIVFFIITFNLSLTYLAAIRNVIPLSVIFGITAFIFLKRYLEQNKSYLFYLFCSCYFLTTISFESGFISIPQLGIYAILTLYFSDYSKEEKVRKMTRITSAMVLLFLPYLIIHQYIYAFPIPFGRTTTPITLTWFIDQTAIFYFKLIYEGTAIAIAEGSHKVPSVGYFLLALVPISLPFLGKYKLDIISRKAWIIYVAFICQVFLIVITNRASYGAQMWLLPGLFFCVVLSDMFYNIYIAISRKVFSVVHIHRTIRLVIGYGLLFWLAFFLYDFNKPLLESLNVYAYGWQFTEKANDSNAFNLAINEPADKYLVLRKNDALPISHFESIWLGNKVYFNKRGLWLYPEALMLNKKNMLVHYFNNNQMLGIDHFMKYFVRDYNKTGVVMIKGPYLFSRLYLDSNRKELSRAAAIGYHGLESYELLIPELDSGNRPLINLKVSFSGNVAGLRSIILNENPIEQWEIINSNTVEFSTTRYNDINKLTLKGISRKMQLRLIEVNLTDTNEKRNTERRKDISNNDSITLHSPFDSVFVLQDGDHEIYGTIEKNQNLPLSSILPLFNNTESVSLSAWEIGPIRNREVVQSVISKADLTGKVIEIAN